jgi:hypothetical protein
VNEAIQFKQSVNVDVEGIICDWVPGHLSSLRSFERESIELPRALGPHNEG